jgi:hypothetical protein
LQNPEQFDPQRVGRYTVIRVEVEYPGEPASEKLFVVLRHHKRNGEDCILCLKTTSKTARYEADRELMKGCILYQAGATRFFPSKTVIEVSNPHGIYHRIIHDAAAKGRYRIEGKMPDDFHGKLMNAIKNCDIYNANEKRLLLEAIGAAEGQAGD